MAHTDFGPAVAEVREEAGVTQKEMAGAPSKCIKARYLDSKAGIAMQKSRISTNTCRFWARTGHWS